MWCRISSITFYFSVVWPLSEKVASETNTDTKAKKKQVSLTEFFTGIGGNDFEISKRRLLFTSPSGHTRKWTTESWHPEHIMFGTTTTMAKLKIYMVPTHSLCKLQECTSNTRLFNSSVLPDGWSKYYFFTICHRCCCCCCIKFSAACACLFSCWQLQHRHTRVAGTYPTCDDDRQHMVLKHHLPRTTYMQNYQFYQLQLSQLSWGGSMSKLQVHLEITSRDKTRITRSIAKQDR